MRVQVAALHRVTGRPVSIVATSEGTLVARAYLGLYRDEPVRDLVMLSPLVRPARVYYPPPGEQAWGVVTRWGLRGLGSLVTAVGPFDLDPDMPFIRSLLAHAVALRDGMTCPVPGVRVRALLPFAGAAAVTPAARTDIPVDVVPGFHGAAVDVPDIRRILRRVLGDTAGPQAGVWDSLNRFVRAGAAAWLPPELPFGFNPAWQVPDGTGRGRCARAAAAFERWSAEVAPAG